MVGRPITNQTMRLLSNIFLPSRGPKGSRLKAARVRLIISPKLAAREAIPWGGLMSSKAKNAADRMILVRGPARDIQSDWFLS